MELKEKIVDTTTNEETFRLYSAAEIAEVEKQKAEIAAKLLEEITKSNARKILLEKLGITEEEAKLLLS